MIWPLFSMNPVAVEVLYSGLLAGCGKHHAVKDKNSMIER